METKHKAVIGIGIVGLGALLLWKSGAGQGQSLFGTGQSDQPSGTIGTGLAGYGSPSPAYTTVNSPNNQNFTPAATPQTNQRTWAMPTTQFQTRFGTRYTPAYGGGTPAEVSSWINKGWIYSTPNAPYDYYGAKSAPQSYIDKVFAASAPKAHPAFSPNQGRFWNYGYHGTGRANSGSIGWRSSNVARGGKAGGWGV